MVIALHLLCLGSQRVIRCHGNDKWIIGQKFIIDQGMGILFWRMHQGEIQLPRQQTAFQLIGGLLLDLQLNKWTLFMKSWQYLGQDNGS